MNVKKVYIKFDGKSFDYTLGSAGNSPGTGKSVSVFPGDKIKWVARKKDIKANSFNGFDVDFGSNTPFPGKSSFKSTPAASGSEHSADSESAGPNLGRFKYSVTLRPGGESDDPEVRVEEPGADQNNVTVYMMRSEIAGGLECPDVTVYDLDLVRAALDPADFELVQFSVTFPRSSPLCEATLRTGEFRVVRNTNTTFWYQIQPVPHEMKYTYHVEIRPLGLEGEGTITVLPRPHEKHSAA